MIFSWLLTIHIIVLGYWLGSELVINSLYRYVCYSDQMPLAERGRLMDRVMRVDQHVRYALILQLGIGGAIAAAIGYIPGGETTVWAALAAAGAWLLLVEIVHQTRATGAGRILARADRGLRYAVMALLLALGAGVIGGNWSMPGWLLVKLILFAGVIGCGVGIRFALIGHFDAWAELERPGTEASSNARLRKTYLLATSILGLLWIFIVSITVLSVIKPVFTS